MYDLVVGTGKNMYKTTCDKGELTQSNETRAHQCLSRLSIRMLRSGGSNQKETSQREVVSHLSLGRRMDN